MLKCFYIYLLCNICNFSATFLRILAPCIAIITTFHGFFGLRTCLTFCRSASSPYEALPIGSRLKSASGAPLASTGTPTIVSKSVTKNSGAPFSFLFDKIVTSTTDDAIIAPEAPEPMRADINNDVNYLNISHVAKNVAPKETQKEFEEYQLKQLSDIENRSALTEVEETEEEEHVAIKSSPSVAEMDWDDSWATRLWSRIQSEKKQREHELLLLQQGNQQLEVERQQMAQLRQNLDSRQNDLEARESKLQSILPLVPSCRELQAFGITFDLLFPYLLSINEKATTENIDQKSAAQDIAQILRAYRNLESLQRCVEKTERAVKRTSRFF